MLRFRSILIVAMLMAGMVPAIAKPIPCWLVKAAITLTGSEEAAEKVAIEKGYTKDQVAMARRKCLPVKS
jgi:hypothetical protein